MTDYLWILSTTVASAGEAKNLAQGAIEARRAACAQIDPEIQSLYIWEGALEANAEWRILFKTTEEGKDALVDWIKARHPYEVPEILLWRAESANPAYTKWARKV
ncbi:MAG: divalent-cation tolerance protein CutA [Puniceicoccaceae bacterium]